MKAEKDRTVDPLEQEVTRVTKALAAIETRRDAIDAALAAARDEHGTAKKAAAVELRAVGAAKALAFQRGSAQPALDALAAAELAERAAAQGVAALESARAEIQQIWKAARLTFLRAATDQRRTDVARLQAAFTALGDERKELNRALDLREHAIADQQRAAHAEVQELEREADNLRRAG